MVAKFVRFIGHTSHAGGQPDKGINALYAAHVALAGINALRETFRDQDHVRVHPIITRGGDVVNAIPGDVRMELFCRAATLDAIEQTHLKVDRALKAGALALGGSVEITTLPGYLPLSNDGTMVNLFIENARSIVGADQVRRSDYHGGGSTDMGDLAHIMPVLHPSAAGARGSAHGADFFIDDYTKSVIDPAKALAMTAIDLLADDARQAKQIKADFRPKMSRSEYVAYLDRMTYTQTWKASDLDG
jgi:metal-dependent amidase/aminoacylase/carboxypeptidase family protein